MLLRLHNDPITYDVRTGHQGWGNALHASTWGKEKPRIEGPFWRRRKIERASVMVHLNPPPRAGIDKLRFTVQGGDKTVLIAEVEWTVTVDDMYTLILEPLP
jgi:hypothetical protein